MNFEEVIAASVSDAMEKALSESVKHITNLANESAKKIKYSPDDLLTEKQAAEYLNVEVSTLQQWRHYKKYLPYCILGNKTIRYKFSDILEFVTSNRVIVAK